MYTVQWKSWPWIGNQAIGYSLLKTLQLLRSDVKLFNLKDKSCCHSFLWICFLESTFPGFAQPKPSRLWICSVFSRDHNIGSTWPGGSTCVWVGTWQGSSHLKRCLYVILEPSGASKLCPWDAGSLRGLHWGSRWWPGRYCRAPPIEEKGVSERISALNTFIVNSKKRHFTTRFISS